MRDLARVALALLLVTFGLCMSSCTDAPDLTDERDALSGPLALPLHHGWAYTASPGTSFTDGLELLYLDSDKLKQAELPKDSEAILEDVSLAGAEGLSITGALLAPPGRGYASVQVMRAWPPHARDAFKVEDLVSFEGTAIMAGQDGASGSWELLLRIAVDQNAPEIARRNGITVTYAIGDQRYSDTIPAELVVCTTERTAPCR